MNANSFIVQISKIFSATVIAHLITIAFSPLLSRMYSPEAFGVLAFVLSVANPLTSLVNLRLDQAVFLPENDQDARKVVALAAFSSVVFCLFAVVVLSLLKLLQFSFSFNVFMLIVLLIATIAIQMPVNTYLQRIKNFNAVGTGKILQTAAISIFSLMLSFYLYNIGLSIAYLLGWLLYLLYVFYTSGLSKKLHFSITEIKDTLKRYKEFPLYHAIPTVISSFTLSIPVFYFSKQFSDIEIGWFNFARQTLMIPVTLIATAIAQVYFGRLVELKRNGHRIMPSYLKLNAAFALISLIMTATILFFGKELFAFVFGQNWFESGAYARWLVISAGIQLLVWPFNIVPIALGRIKLNSSFQIIHFLLMACVFVFHPESPQKAIQYLVSIDVLFFTVYGLFVFYCVKQNDLDLKAV